MTATRRFLVLVLVLLGMVTTTTMPSRASASSWHHFSSKSFGFSMQYPGNWTLTRSDLPKQITIQHTGGRTYSLQVAVLGVKPGKSIGVTMNRVKAYERARGNSSFLSIRWGAVSVSGHAGMAGILRPPTEGGVAISDGIYITASKKHVFEITTVAYGAASLAHFPSVYRTILGSWRFL